MRIGNCFTEYASLTIEPCEKRYGGLSELKRLLQLARKKPVSFSEQHYGINLFTAVQY